MAYLDLTATHPFEAVKAVSPATLSAQQQIVVMLSRGDPLWSLQPQARRSRLLRWLFGVEAPHRLADRKLEALRRYAVQYRLLGETVEAADAAGSAGLARSQLAQVRQILDRQSQGLQRSAPPSMQRALLTLSAMLTAAGAAAWFGPHIG